MQKRSLGQMILYSVITLGIYQIFWLYYTKREMVAKGYKIPPFKLLFLPLLALLAIIPLQFLSLMNSAGNSDASGATILITVVSLFLGIIFLIAIIPITLYWYYKYCQAVALVTKDELTFATSYALFIVLSVLSVSFVWPFIVQESFNKVTDDGFTPTVDPPYPTIPQSPLPPQPPTFISPS